MYIKQISVFVENKTGRLADITGILAKNNINIHALSIADTTDFGILRLIADDSDKALAALKAENLAVKVTDVVGVSMPHRAGGLHEVLKKMEENHIGIEYLYDFLPLHDPESATIVFRLNNQDEAVKTMKEIGITMLDSATMAPPRNN